MRMRLLPDDKHLGWTPYVWLVYLVPMVLYPLSTHAPPATVASTFAGAALFLALYFRAHWVRGRELMRIIAAITLLGVLFLPVNAGAGALFIFAASFAANTGRPRVAAMTIFAVVITLTVEALLLDLPPDRWWWGILFSLIVGAVNVHYTQLGRSNDRLRLAQSEIEHLAKVAERERIARDLHDLLGHTLSVIILKSELASKMAERDVERARTEIRDVERISRQALAQVRAAVRGFRSGGLQAELEETRRTFAAAGVTLTATLEPVVVPPATEAVLVLAIREAVTNVVRHARASTCRIDIHAADGNCTVTVADDGRGSSASFGNGLSGMRERVESLGGTLSVEGKRGMTVTIAVPLPIAEVQLARGVPA